MNNYISKELENLEILADKMTDEANDLVEMANDLLRAAGFEDACNGGSFGSEHMYIITKGELNGIYLQDCGLRSVLSEV